MKERAKYIYVGDIPMLMPERNVSRQFQIEMWLDATPMYKSLGLKTPEQEASDKRRQYVV